MRISRRLPLAVAALTSPLVLSACTGEEEGTSQRDVLNDRTSQATPSTKGSTPEPSASEDPAPSADRSSTDDPISEAPLLSVSILGDEVLPNAEAIDLATGDVLLVEIVSDRAGELRIHAKPEQFLAFKAGTTNAKLVIDTPGSVEIEDHDTGAVVAVLEVR